MLVFVILDLTVWWTIPKCHKRLLTTRNAHCSTPDVWCPQSGDYRWMQPHLLTQNICRHGLLLKAALSAELDRGGHSISADLVKAGPFVDLHCWREQRYLLRLWLSMRTRAVTHATVDENRTSSNPLCYGGQAIRWHRLQSRWLYLPNQTSVDGSSICWFTLPTLVLRSHHILKTDSRYMLQMPQVNN